ncbi:hypothetical protein [Parabacteroides faecis]|uniref:hypothetical protein n=1 Tax=Parabacteroides faecis TaxID=1217282 RepID=UPI003521A31B
MREIGVMLLVLLAIIVTIFTESEKQIKYLIDLAGPIVALVGILLTIPIIRKKLIENHISKTLIDIQEGNKKLISAISDIEDEYYCKAHINKHIEIEELQNVAKQIQYLYKVSQEANRDSQTMFYYLKVTLLNIVRDRNDEFLFTRDLYGLILFVFNHVEFFCNQVIPIPNSTKLIKNNLINSKYKKAVTNSDYIKYKAFNKGIIYDPHSAHYLIFYDKINNMTDLFIQKSAFSIFRNTAPLRKLLWGENIYAPFELGNKRNDAIFGRGKLSIISFNTVHYVNEDRYTVKIIYGNTNDSISFKTFYDSEEKLKSSYIDMSIEKSGFSFEKMINMKNLKYECISIEFELEYLRLLFKKNRRKIEKIIMQ